MRKIRAGFRLLLTEARKSKTMLLLRFYGRLLYFCRIRKALRTLEAPDAFPNTLMHNLKSLAKPMNRMELLIRPLSVLEQVDKNARVLIIGPRNEWDLFLMEHVGFSFERCSGLDLISYSPKVHLGDMHAIPFHDGEFDVVLCGWTISYSADPAKACGEIARVCKKRGVIGVAVEYSTADAKATEQVTGGYTIQDSRLKERINSVGQMLDLFQGHGAVFFAHDAPLKRSHPVDPLPSNCATIFENRS